MIPRRSVSCGYRVRLLCPEERRRLRRLALVFATLTLVALGCMAFAQSGNGNGNGASAQQYPVNGAIVIETRQLGGVILAILSTGITGLAGVSVKAILGSAEQRNQVKALMESQAAIKSAQDALAVTVGDLKTQVAEVHGWMLAHTSGARGEP